MLRITTMGSSRRIPFLSTHQSSPKSAHPGATQSARNPPCCLGILIKAVTNVRPKTGRVGVFRGQEARYGTGTLILDSGELPHELGYPPQPLSHREIPHDSIVNIAFIGSSIYLLVVILLVTLPVNSRQIDLRVGYLIDSLLLSALETE